MHVRGPRLNALLISLLLTGTTAVIVVQTSAQAAQLPAAYKAAAHGDIVALEATVVPAGSLAGVRIGHSSGSLDSTTAAPNSRAESANLDGSALLDNLPLDVDSVFATAPPRSGPTSRTLLPIPPNPLLNPGLIEGSVLADYTSATACPVAVDGARVYSDSVTSLAQTTVGDLSAVPGAPSPIASIGASRVRTVTRLVDDAVGGSDVEAVTTTTVGDVSLFGGQAVVKVTSPVVLRAHSDGTTGTAAFDSPPTVQILLPSAPAIPVPLNGSPVNVPIIIPGLNSSVTVTGFGLTDTSSGVIGAATLQALLRVDVDLTLATTPVADVSLSLAPMDVRADAPAGGVTCTQATPTPTPTATPTTDNPDRDGDGLTNVHEAKLGTDPDNPDTDGDGLTDGREVKGMVIRHRFEVCRQKVRNKIRVVTNPLMKDTDGDGIKDGREVKGYRIKQIVFVTRSGKKINIGKTRSNPTKADTDKDGLKDKVEKKGSANKKFKRRKTDPTKCDTDRGGVNDGREVKLGSDPTRIKSGPNDFRSRMTRPGEGYTTGG